LSRATTPLPPHRLPPYGGSVRRRRVYFVLMGTCLTLFLLSGLVVRLFSPPLAIAMAAVALVIPPIAVIIANGVPRQ
jgi:cytochrome b subunit of formate dehydrogenase